MKLSKLAMVLFLSASSLGAFAGGADAGGFPYSPEPLKGDKFSYACNVEIYTETATLVQQHEISNEASGRKVESQAGGVFKAYNEQGEFVEVSGPEAYLRDELEDAHYYVIEGMKPNEFELYINGKVKGIQPQLWLTSKHKFSSSDETIEADLHVIQYGKTLGHGIRLNCKKN